MLCLLLLTPCFAQVVVLAVVACFWRKKSVNNNPFNKGWPSQYSKAPIIASPNEGATEAVGMKAKANV